MKIEICTNKPQWIEPATGSFLQSWEWGDFQEKFGKKPLRLQIKDNHTIVAQLQGLTSHLGGGIKYLYVPKYYASSLQDHNELFVYLKKTGYTFVRVEPIHELDWKVLSVSSKKIKNRQPKQTMVVSLTNDIEIILSSMHSKTRYNIRLAKKKGVTIKKENDIEIFWNLNRVTTARDEFKSHQKKYYAEMLTLSMVHQFTAYYLEKPIATIICIGSGNTFTYLHGASSNEHRNVMAPYALQLHAMEYAKEEGYKQYDLWGVSPKSESEETCFHHFCWDKKDAWNGVTRFKAGFGGTYVSFPDAVDVILKSASYFLYKTARVCRKFI